MNHRATRMPAHRVWRGAIVSEGVKLWSLRSFRVLLAVAVTMIAASGAMLSVGLVARLTDERFAGQEIAATPMMFVDSVLWAQVVVAIVAVLAVTNEYSSGQVRLSLLALPTRLPWLGAKALVLGGAGFLVGVTGSAISLGVSALTLPDTEVRYEIRFADAALLTVGSGLYLAAIALLVVGLAAALRHVVAGLVTVLGVLVVLPPILGSIPGLRVGADYLPTIAGRRLISDFETVTQLSPWLGFGILVGWAAAALLLSGVLLKTRDA